MSDRELLEMAAKAAGLVVVFNKYSDCYRIGDIAGAPFRPLSDDGDALRLAVKLRLDLTFYSGFQEIHVEESTGSGEPVCEDYASEPLAAVRRAIVRAAAEIGKSM